MPAISPSWIPEIIQGECHTGTKIAYLWHPGRVSTGITSVSVPNLIEVRQWLSREKRIHGFYVFNVFCAELCFFFLNNVALVTANLPVKVLSK